jgi:riboflavin kinase/FMN adenylyltransferase
MTGNYYRQKHIPMKIYYGFEEVEKIKNAVVTTGSFDGVHMGHQKILSRLKELANESDGESVVITFYPHPRKVLYPDTAGRDLLMINTRKEKIHLLEKAGIQHLIFVEFTHDFANTTSAEFVTEYLVKKLKTKIYVTGQNHHFGKNRDGDIDELQKLGNDLDFKVELIPLQDIQNVDVSSTLIRESIIRGRLSKANIYLTHPYFVIGQLQLGSQHYKRMGYQTFRIEIAEKYKLIPPCGSYRIKINFQGYIENGIALISTCTNSLAESVLDIYVKNLDRRDVSGREIVIYFVEELSVQDEEKKGSLLNSIMMKDLIRFDSNG